MKLNKNSTAVFLTIYGVITLAGRFMAESALRVGFVTSMLIGLVLISIILVLFKTGFLTLKD